MSSVSGGALVVCVGLVVVGCLGGAKTPKKGGTDHQGSSMPDGGAAGAESSGAGDAAGAEPQGPRCTEGQACECGGGLVSTTVCVTGIELCECGACPAVAPAEKEPDFLGCGGEPFGTWGAVDVDLSALSWLFVTTESGVVVGERRCPAAMPTPEDVVFTLRLDDGGKGRMHFSGLFGRGTVLSSCIEGERVSCGDYEGCEAKACGTCECSNISQQLSSNEVGWVRAENELQIDVDGELQVFGYCVIADTLALMPKNDSGIVFTLHRGYTGGTPLACSERDAADCAGSGCKLGVCVGTGSCAQGVDELSCTNRAGCSWEPERCVGTATACTFADYGKVPGCEFTTGGATCSGTPTPCENRLGLACQLSPYCEQTQSGCYGFPPACAEIMPDDCVNEGCTLIPD